MTIENILKKIENNPPKTLKEMKKLQQILSKYVILKGKFDAKYVVGVDQAFAGDTVISACVALKLPELDIVCKLVNIEKTDVPYIPTYLMFREGNPALHAVKKIIDKLNSKVCLMVDGSGAAHPRKCGLATYLGLALNVQSIGVTKSKLYGFFTKEPTEVMEYTEMYDEKGEIIGYVLKTCKNCKPIFVSPGHLISAKESLMAVIKCLKGYKLPEPIRLAHELATYTRKKGNLTLDSFQ